MEWTGEFSEDHTFVELLIPGVSSDVDFEQFLKDTEEKLSLNASSIEQHLKELQAKMGDFRTGDRPPSPTEVLQWFNMRAQNSLKPLSTDILDFFRALQQYLKSEEEGKEEVTLQLLLNLSAQCGVYFPCPSSSSSLHPHLPGSSVHSIHTIKDDSATEIQEAWDAVRLQLRNFLMDRLSCYTTGPPGSPQFSTMTILERVNCFKQLLFLYPEREVVADYQGLKQQYVLSILHSSMSSSPGGESGFDRLSTGFCNVVQHVTQALTEELQVLSRVVEPQVVLGFLNVAYFGAIAQEMTSQMEREFETAQRDNTALSSKIKKYSVRSRATVAPMELPLKSRSFSLTSHQLRALTQLACVLLGFERDVRERVTNITFINCTGDTPTLKGILKKPKEDSGLTTDGKKPTADKPHTPEAQTLEFNWRLAFSRLVPHMEHCVKVVLDDVCAKNLQQEEGLHSSGHTLVTTGSIADFSVSNEHLKEDFFYKGSERDTPKMTAKFCGAILIELDALLPLAVACRDTSLLGVRSSFVEACSRAAFAMLGRLQERALEVPSSAPLKNLPALLASCIYVQQRLEHYNVMLKDSSTASAKISLTLLPIQRYQEAVKALREQLTSYCVQVCLTCILQDAESHDWADPKPFYEGERCSFALQMWFYFLCGLRSDLWSVLPPELAKDVLGYVLAETLQLLVRRYSRVRASYKRHLQIRCDITAVLLYVEHLMWSVSESPEDVIQINPSSEMTIIGGGSDWPYQIHILCDQLLTVLLVVTAPISFLHRSFMNSASKDSAPRHPERHVVRWLNAINPDRFPEQVIRDGLTGEAALACQLRLLTSDPGCSPKLLLQMLLYEDCHLPRILLENSYFCQKTDSEMSTESCKAGNDFIVALFNLFSCLNNVPKALTQALQPYLEKAHIWKYLYTLADTTHKAPVVIDCVRALVIKSANSILVHLVSMAVAWPGMEDCNQAHQFKQKVPESVLAKIPKDWNYTLPDGRGKDTASKAVISLAIQALSFIFTNLPLAVSSLPLPIRFVFQMAEKHLSQHARQLRSMGLLLWALLGCLIQGLEDPDALEEISGLALDCRAKEYLSLLRECLQAAMSIQHKGIPKPTVHKVLQALEERRPKWMNIQLQKARKLCAGSISEQGADRGAAAAELTEQKIGLMLLEVCHKAGGCAYLRQIYHIIQGNEDLLMSKLNGNTDSTELSVKFDVSPESVDRTACFNPLLQFDHIGKKRLNQSQVVEWTWDWPRLLPAYEGMSQVTFRSLVANRWDMQEDAELEDGERAMVEELQKAFFVCCCSAGPQDASGTDETPTNQTQGETEPCDKSFISVICMRDGPMRSHLICTTSALYILWIIMAQVAGQEDREKTTALKDLLSRIDLDELMKKDEPPFVFPNTLEEFEYAFNENGQLRHIQTGEPFEFNAREDLHRWNQKRYEALGEIITKYVYELLEKKCNLTKEFLPVDATDDEPRSFIYLSTDALTNPNKLLVLIQGSGVVRAGQWARRLIINQDLDSGTQIPFIMKAMEEDYGVMVLNPNENYLEVEKPAKDSPINSPAEPSDEPAEKRERKDEQESKKKREFYEKYRNPQKETETERIPIRENTSSEEHVLYVWDHFVSKAAAKNVFIIAHSYGGLSFVELMNQREMQVKNRVCAVALTDSAHNIWHQETSKGTQDWMQQCCCNWVSSPEPLDTQLEPMLPDCPRVSAGTERHELTSWMSFESIFRFFNEVLKTKEEEEAEENSNVVTTRSGSLKNKHQDL